MILLVLLIIAIPFIILAHPPFNNWNNFVLILGLEVFLIIILIVLFIIYIKDKLKEKHKDVKK